MTQADALAAAPTLVLVLGACAVVALDLVLAKAGRVLVVPGALVSLAAGILAPSLGAGEAGFGGSLARDGASIALTLVVGVSAAAALLLASDYLEREGVPAGEFVALVLLSSAGAVLMASSADLVVIFLGLELLSLPLYALTGLLPRAAHGDEGALKYFLLGAATSAVFLYGVALIYATTGRVSLGALRLLGGDVAAPAPLFLAGLGLIVTGLAFKAALVPFHTWAPDAYVSAPTPATAFMAVVAKVGAFGALLRIAAATSAGSLGVDWAVSLAALAAATLVVASLAAIGQRRVKRLLAYSSIAHAGYLTMGSATGSLAGPPVLFYLAVYAALTIGAFGAIALLDDDDPTIDDLAGLWGRRPLLVLGLGVILVGLTGLPPTGGFVAKLFVFEAAMRAQLLWLVVVGVLASVVGAAYYFRVLLACFQPGDGLVARGPSPRIGGAVVGLAALAVIASGVAPGVLLDLAQRVAY